MKTEKFRNSTELKPNLQIRFGLGRFISTPTKTENTPIPQLGDVEIQHELIRWG